MLTPTQRQQYDRDGFLVLPAFRGVAALAELRARAEALVQAFEPDAASGVFSTRNPAVTADAALIASADAVHCFFEEEAFDAAGRLVVPKDRPSTRSAMRCTTATRCSSASRTAPTSRHWHATWGWPSRRSGSRC